jgi:hypothetical protein
MTMSVSRALLPVSLFLLLCACSGGGSNNNNSGESVMTGQFIDSTVSGVRYTTGTRSGVTDSQGKFEYLEGETVTFYLGDLELGDAQGAAIISLFDLVDGVTPVVGKALEEAVWESKRGLSFSTVINLAVFLQTLDRDGNPDNGIDISPDVAALFAPNSVNFNRHWDDFSSDHGFIQAISLAKARALLDGSRQMRKPWRAVAHLYASLDIDSRLRVASSKRTDYATGRIPFNKISYQFDAEGKLIREEYDADGDGTPDGFEVYTYDTDGNLIRYELDYSAMYSASLYNYIKNFTYDVDGNLIRSEIDFGNDGTADSTTTYAYDTHRNLIYRVEHDFDGSPDRRYTFVYDTDDNQIRFEADSDGDGKPEYISMDTYDAAGNQIRSEEDDNGDGKADAIVSYFYDADDNLIRYEADPFGDGIPLEIFSYTYDADGNLIRYEADLNANGTLDQIFIYDYDANGNLTRKAYLLADGIPHSIFTNTYTYDANGSVIRRVIDDTDGDGNPESINIYTFDANGNLTRDELDSDGDGFPESVSTTVYDADGNIVRLEQDGDGDGTPEWITTYTYDANANGWSSLFNDLSQETRPF